MSTSNTCKDDRPTYTQFDNSKEKTGGCSVPFHSQTIKTINYKISDVIGSCVSIIMTN